MSPSDCCLNFEITPLFLKIFSLFAFFAFHSLRLTSLNVSSILYIVHRVYAQTVCIVHIGIFSESGDCPKVHKSGTIRSGSSSWHRKWQSCVYYTRSATIWFFCATIASGSSARQSKLLHLVDSPLNIRIWYIYQTSWRTGRHYFEKIPTTNSIFFNNR